MKKESKKKAEIERKRCVEIRDGFVRKRQRQGRRKKNVSDIRETESQHICVYNNYNIISSVASKQQSDTNTTQAGA